MDNGLIFPYPRRIVPDEAHFTLTGQDRVILRMSMEAIGNLVCSSQAMG
jgi:hypothetical protein